MVKVNMQRRCIVPLFILLGLVVTALFAFDSRLTVVNYKLETGKVSAPVRLALLTDLHSCTYGAGQRELLDAVAAQFPDAILLSGDIVDDDKRLPEENALAVVRALAEKYPVYYVTGNHEFWNDETDAVRARLSQAGAVVLAGTSAFLAVAGQTLQICGVDDPAVGESVWQGQLGQVTAEKNPLLFSVLLSHRPERVSFYNQAGFDLVLAGHAHGGQWRLPGVINGLIAPDQGLLPKYAGGLYPLDGTTLIVSRGLARESTRVPRIFNRPEVVIADITPPSPDVTKKN